jgi:hypothetical protein
VRPPCIRRDRPSTVHRDGLARRMLGGRGASLVRFCGPPAAAPSRGCLEQARRWQKNGPLLREACACLNQGRNRGPLLLSTGTRKLLRSRARRKACSRPLPARARRDTACPTPPGEPAMEVRAHPARAGRAPPAPPRPRAEVRSPPRATPPAEPTPSVLRSPFKPNADERNGRGGAACGCAGGAGRRGARRRPGGATERLEIDAPRAGIN